MNFRGDEFRGDGCTPPQLVSIRISRFLQGIGYSAEKYSEYVGKWITKLNIHIGSCAPYRRKFLNFSMMSAVTQMQRCSRPAPCCLSESIIRSILAVSKLTALTSSSVFFRKLCRVLPHALFSDTELRQLTFEQTCFCHVPS